MLAPPLFGFLAPFGEAVVLLWIALLSYGAYIFLTVVQQTASGGDVVAWPGDPWTEQLAAFFHLAALASVWLGPVFFLAWSELLPLSTSALMLIVAGFLWLVFPISLLSSLSAPSRLAILRPLVLRRLLRHAPALLGYYLITGVVLFLSLSVFGLAIAMGRLEPPEVPAVNLLSELYDWMFLIARILLLPVAAVTAAAGLLIYARLVGRLGLILHLAGHAEKEAAFAERTFANPSLGTGRPTAAERPTQVLVSPDTTGVPPDVYPLLPEGLTPDPAVPMAVLSVNDVFAALPADSASRQKAVLMMRQTQPSRVDLRLTRTVSAPRPPRWPLLQGVFTFPFYRSNWRTLAVLSLGNLLVAVLLYLFVQIVPF